ncbi:N-acetyltransferase [Gordonibacter sp. Marseille-P4307]|uniref:GNAT family N-acetyltransferase n=1 Tax=Gordonibacter sp. Marseille-P4307 TaxID=2161815 RepID=UPI000F53127B|nr:GNAT family N-acetyltransferase [Gordonibacter sp. Marseille-P4307]
MAGVAGKNPSPVASLQDFFEIMRAFKESAASGVHGNCYLMPNKVESLVSEGALSFAAGETTLAFFERRDGFIQVHFLRKEAANSEASDKAALDMLAEPREELLMAEIPFSAKSAGEDIPGGARASIDFLERCGFSTARISRRLSLRPTVCDSQPGAPENGRGLDAPASIEIASVSDAASISRMLEKGFDPFCDYIPTDRELRDTLSSGRVYCIRDASESPVAFLHWSRSGAASELKHLYVEDGARGRGYARMLVRRYLENLPLNVKTCFLWVNDANEPALALYDGLGYRFDGRRAVELTKGI